jgi:chromosome segregation ATPase
MAGPDPKIQVDITARDKASEVIEGVADEAAKLEELSPEIPIGADTATATADIKAVAEAAEAAARADHELVLRAKIDQAKGELKALQTELDTTGQHAKDATDQLDRVDSGGGSNLRGNAIADLTGPLGEASGAASDFAGVFDGLGDIAGETASKLGLSQDAAGKLSGMIGGLGVAVAAGAAVWSLWTARQKAAEAAAKEHREQIEGLAEAIRKGDREAATANFHKLYDEAISSAEKFGLKAEDVTRFLSGETTAIPGLTAKWKELSAARDADVVAANKARAAGETFTGTAEAQAKAFEDLTEKMGLSRAELESGKTASKEKAAADDHLADVLVGAESKQKDMNRAVADSVTTLSKAERATADLEAGYSALNDRLSDKRAIEDWRTAMEDAQTAVHDGNAETVVDLRAVEDAIVHAAKVAGLTPIQTQAVIDTAQTDVDKAFLMMQSMIDAKGPLNANLKIHPELPPRLKIVTRGGTTILDEALVPISSAAAAPSSVVNVNMPRGVRHSDIQRAVGYSARRNGKRFGVRAS